MCVSSPPTQNLYVEILTPNVGILGDGAFWSDMIMRLEHSPTALVPFQDARGHLLCSRLSYADTCHHL